MYTCTSLSGLHEGENWECSRASDTRAFHNRASLGDYGELLTLASPLSDGERPVLVPKGASSRNPKASDPSVNFCSVRDFVVRATATRAHPSVDPSTDGKVVVCLVAPGGRESWETSLPLKLLSRERRSCSGSAGSAFELCARYLVDPASSHMLVSKIKPCMSKYKPH